MSHISLPLFEIKKTGQRGLLDTTWQPGRGLVAAIEPGISKVAAEKLNKNLSIYIVNNFELNHRIFRIGRDL